MSTKKPAALLAVVGACALAVTGPAALASPLPPGPTGTHDGAATSLPVGDIDTARTSKSGQSAPSSTGAEADPAYCLVVGGYQITASTYPRRRRCTYGR